MEKNGIRNVNQISGTSLKVLKCNVIEANKIDGILQPNTLKIFKDSSFIMKKLK